jgi:hypothetical protein
LRRDQLHGMSALETGKGDVRHAKSLPRSRRPRHGGVCP